MSCTVITLFTSIQRGYVTLYTPAWGYNIMHVLVFAAFNVNIKFEMY